MYQLIFAVNKENTIVKGVYAMDGLEHIKSLILNDYFQAIMAVLGTVFGAISIFQAVNPSKRIRYVVAKNKEKPEYLVCFWNASFIPVYRNDIYHFYVMCNKNARFEKLFQTDDDVPIECKEGDLEKIEDYHLDKSNETVISIGRMKIFDFSFDFLPLSAGAIFHITNDVAPDGSRRRMRINGRIIGEKAESIAQAEMSKSRRELWDYEVSRNRVLDFCGGLLYFFCMPIIVYAFSSAPMSLSAFLTFVGFSLFGVWKIRKFIINGMPKKLRKQFRRECKERGFVVSYWEYDNGD